MFLPVLIATQLFINNKVKYNMSLPVDHDEENINYDLVVDNLMPIFMGGMAFASPSIVGLNWQIA